MASSGRPQDVWKASAAARPPGGRAPARGKGRWFAAALAVVALGGAIAGLLFYLWPDPPPVILAMPVTAYNQPDWPPNPWAEADARSLLERAPEGGAQTFQAQDKQAILRELDRAAAETRKQPLVVYLSALGVAATDKVHLIPGGGRPDDPSTWLALDEVLARVRRATTPRLLILDVRPATDPRAVLTGQDVNDVLDGTLAKLSTAGELPFLVLTANTPAAGAASLRPFKRSAFGLALAHGAGGAADGWNPELKRDGRVSARELAAYTREVTHQIAANAGFPDQTPRLHGSGGDFDLFTTPRTGPAPLPTLGDLEPYPDWLQAAWKDRDAWAADNLDRRAPRVFHHFTLATMRAEQHWLAGGNGDAIKAAFDVPASRLRAVRPSFSPLASPASSVARAERKPGLTIAAATSALQPVFNRVLETPSPERDKALVEAMKAVWDKPPEAEPFDAVAVVVFTFARNLEKPTHDQMKHLAALLGGLRPRPPRHAELQSISLVGGLTPEQVEKWPAGTIALLLGVARDAEDAAAIDGRCLPWIRDALAKADETRRTALRDLCNPRNTNAMREAAVAALDAAGKDYRTVRAAAGALTSAFHEYEETRAVLVDLAVAYPFDALPLSKELGSRWHNLADDFGKLQQMLRAPAAPALPNGAELERATQTVLAGRQFLRQALSVPDSGSVRQYERLLRWPHWSQAERGQLLARLAEAERAAVRRVLDSWPKEPPNRDTPTAPPMGDQRTASDAGELHRTMKLLQLVEGPDAGDLKTEFDRLGARPAHAAVAELARKVRLASRRKLAETYLTADPARQALMGWMVDPDDVPAYEQPGSAGPPNPEAPERRGAEKAFHDWLANKRYGADAAAFDAMNNTGARNAAAGCRDIARAYSEAFR